MTSQIDPERPVLDASASLDAIQVFEHQNLACLMKL
jgi:hypothetical protein